MPIATATLTYQYKAFGPCTQTNLQNALQNAGALDGSVTAVENALNQLYGVTLASDTTTSSGGPGPPILATRVLVFNVGAQFNAMFPGGITDQAAIGAFENQFAQIFENAVGTGPYVLAATPQVVLS